MMTLRLPVGHALDEATGVIDLSYLLKHLFGGVLGSAAVLTFLQDVSGRKNENWRAQLWRYGVPLATATAMSAFFFAKLQPYETLAIYDEPGARTALLLYTVIFLGFLGSSLVSGVRVCWRWGRDSGNGGLGWGLRLIGVGLSAGVLYSVVRIAALISRFEGARIFPGKLDDYLSSYLMFTALVLVVVGSALPALGKVRSRIRQRRALVRLRPLWHDLTSAVPTVRFGEVRSPLTERWDARRVGERLYRRTMEIRDAQLALSDYASPTVSAAARRHVEQHGHQGARAAVELEACRLAAAHHARLYGGSPAPHPHPPPSGGRDLRSEVQALIQLSDAFYSPVARTFVDASRPHTPPPSLEPRS
nr:MAB_1171c family putative transporter [Streptomyces sulphureus]